MRFLVLGGALGPALFATVTLICSALRPDYSHLNHFISELGATGTVHAAFMNYAGFLPTGTLLAGFGVSLAWLLPRHTLSSLAAACFATFGVGVIVAGFFSCDPGCPQAGGSLQNLIHDRSAPISFLSAALGMFFLGIRFRADPEWHRFWLYSLASSIAVLCFLLVLASTLESRVLTGLWQRLLLTTLFTWSTIIALTAYRRSPPVPSAG